MGLNAKQQRFCQEYVKDLNGTAAAIRAGYSKKTAAQQAARLLTNVKVKRKISKLIDRATREAEISLDLVMQELKTIAFASMADFAEWGKKGVTLKESKELGRELQKAVESVGEKINKHGDSQLRIKLHSKLRAIEALLKLHEISEIEARLQEIENELKDYKKNRGY
jgi:phage terminase small subunit